MKWVERTVLIVDWPLNADMQRRVNIAVTLRWDPVGTAHYEQRYKGTPDSNYGSAVPVSGYQTTSVFISGLILGASYDFQVRSRENTSGGWGSFTASTLARAETAGMITMPAKVPVPVRPGQQICGQRLHHGADPSFLCNVAIDLYDHNWRCQGKPEVAVWTARQQPRCAAHGAERPRLRQGFQRAGSRGAGVCTTYLRSLPGLQRQRLLSDIDQNRRRPERHRRMVHLRRTCHPNWRQRPLER